MLRKPIKPLSLSEHAQKRLAERSTLTESELLELLQRNGYRRIHQKMTSDISQDEINLYSKEYGFTFDEMIRHGMVRPYVAYKHLMVWSCSDRKPLTLIVDPTCGTIITVLNSDDFSHHDWSDKVSEDSLADVREKAERLQLSPPTVYELYAQWLDEEGMPKRKNFNKLKIMSISPLIPSLEELEVQARSHVANGRDIWLIVRNKKDHSDIVFEKLLDNIV